jgi:hypothetical protein
MKNSLLFIVMLSFQLAATGQDATPLSVESVVQADGTASELYEKASHWNNEGLSVLTSAKHDQALTYTFFVPYHQSKELWGASEQSRGQILFDMGVYFKDGKYRCVVSNFRHVADDGHSFGVITTQADCPVAFKMTAKFWRNNVWADISGKSMKVAEIMLANIQSFMASSKTVNDEMKGW